MMYFRVLKDPVATLDYSIDFSDWLIGGATLASASWTISVKAGNESTPTLTTPGDSIDGKRAVIWLSGGTDGVAYSVTCHATDTTTPVARQDDRTIVVLAKNK